MANELNIRILPLKTLLVYLAMEEIIRPKFTYFAEYSFKYIKQPPDIINRFEGERKRFVAGEDFDQALNAVRSLNSKKISTTLDILGENVSNHQN